MASRLSVAFEKLYNEVRRDIFALCRRLNFNPTAQQRKILELVQWEASLPPDKRKKRIAVKSGQGPGKTAVSCILAIWRTLLFKGALTIVTGPSKHQVIDNWLAECERILDKADPFLRKLIKVTKSRVIFAGKKNWGINLITASKPENIAGTHEENLTFIADEATGIDRAIMETIKGTLTNENALFVAISNPTKRDSDFFDAFHKYRHLWHTFTMNAEESPIVSKENVRFLEEEYGRNSDVFRVRVLGQFPTEDPHTIMNSEDLEACTQTDIYQCVRDGMGARQFGIDLARFGDDESVIMRRSGLAVVEHKIFVKQEPDHVIDRAFLMQMETGWGDKDCWYVPDADGMGQGAMAKFHNAGKQVHEFRTQGLAFNAMYKGKAAEAWFQLRNYVRSRRIHIPNDNRLIAQLCSREYNLNKKGEIILESKEEYKKRTYQASPDRADALVMAFYYFHGGGRVSSPRKGGKKVGMQT